MRIRTLAMVTVATTLLLVGSATTGSAQQMPGHDMSAMMAGPHHTLALAYHESLAAFARGLQGSLAKATSVDVSLVRPAVADMPRSVDMMQRHHQAQMARMTMMPDSAMRAMTGHGTALAGHLAALDAEVNTATPNRDKVLEHTAEILKIGADMHPRAKP